MNPSAPIDAPAGPSAAEVRAALERILASEPFRASPQLGTFLRYVVEAVLGGRGPSLKGYTIGVEALGRDPRFNPQIDPIVRVEATRLRRAMERYYAGAGIDDPVVIELSRGGYAPTFRRADSAALPETAPTSPALARRRRAPITLATIAVLALFAPAVVLLPHRADVATAPSHPTPLHAQEITGRLPHGNGMPTIQIEPLRVTGTPRPDRIVAGALADRIRDAFSRFDTINVAVDGLDQEGTAAARPDYRLAGRIEYGESATQIRFELVDVAEGTIAWTHAFAYPAATVDASAAEDEIVVGLTNALLQSFGVIRARDRAKQLVSPVGDPRYRCVLAAADSFRSSDPAVHAQARACLENLTSADPSFAVGFEFLAIVYYREYVLDYPDRAGDPPALDRALRMARRAIELAPASARAYQMLFVVQYARHDVAAAFAAADTAIELNKYDMLTLAEYGGRLIMTGDIARGMAMLRRAGENGGVLPSTHHFYLFLGNYVGGDMEAAAFQAGQIIADDYPLGLVAQAVSASRTGNADQARRTIDRLIEVQPAWRNDARRILEKSIYKREIVDRLLHDLAAAGLPGST
jgi:tetratricopeptide (TPR) repeat protein